MICSGMKRICLLLACLSLYRYSKAQTPFHSGDLPEQLHPFIDRIEYQSLGDSRPTIQYESVSKKIWKVSLIWILKDSTRQDDWKVVIHPAYKPDFHWAPHLTPTDDHIIAQHVFRAPALITASSQKQISIIPDLDILQKT